MKSKSNRIKLTLTQPIIETRTEAEALVREIVQLILARKKQEADMDLAITKVREGYEKIMAVADQQITEKSAIARAWAEAHPSEFKGLKTLEMVHGYVGWRTGQHQLKLLSGWTWKKVLTAMQDARKVWGLWIRQVDEVNREKIIADRASMSSDALRSIGCKLVQDESFFIDPKIEDTDNRQTLAKAA